MNSQASVAKDSCTVTRKGHFGVKVAILSTLSAWLNFTIHTTESGVLVENEKECKQRWFSLSGTRVSSIPLPQRATHKLELLFE